MKYVQVLVLLLIEFLCLRKVHSFATPKISATTVSRQQWYQQLHHTTYHQQRSRCTITTKLHASVVKLVYNWRVLPSGSLTGICDDGIITTSALIQPSTAKSNTVVTTASGSQYKLMGDPIAGKNPFAKSLSSPVIPTPSTSGDRDTASLKTAISFVALIAASGIFAVVVLQKLGCVDESILNNIYALSGQSVALIAYCIGIAIASIQLINDVNKASRK